MPPKHHHHHQNFDASHVRGEENIEEGSGSHEHIHGGKDEMHKSTSSLGDKKEEKESLSDWSHEMASG